MKPTKKWRDQEKEWKMQWEWILDEKSKRYKEEEEEEEESRVYEVHIWWDQLLR